MSVESDFLEDFVNALERRTAALFVGAGLSMAANFPDWRRLLRPFAEDVGLDIQREQDLPAVAQFYVNHNAGNRGRLAQVIRNEFRRSADVPENHRLLARLPFEHIWTTNYDELLERAWELHGQRLDVKARTLDLTTVDPEADAVLYKMHGTAGNPDDIVLTQDDYALYAKSRPGFLQILGSDLVTRTFLFLGVSFTDPNLNYLLSLLRSTYLNTPHQHYAVLRRPTDAYDARRFELFITDLQRYGIRTLVVEQFEHIPQLLGRLERRFAQRNVFVAGSYPEAGEPTEREYISRVAHDVGQFIATRGLNLISGFGRVVGRSVVAGMIDKLSAKPGAVLARRLSIRPIRELSTGGLSPEAFKQRQREDMLSQSGIVIFIGGLREGGTAQGVLDEFAIARQKGQVVLPIAATGHAAQRIYEQLLAEPARLPRELELAQLQRLGPDTRSPEAIVTALGQCLDAIIGRRR